jgi:hypothetical protein
MNQTEKYLTGMGLTAGCTFERAELFASYIVERDWADKSVCYLKTWAQRFASRQEWNRSDYAGRAILQNIAAFDYPNNIDAFQN